MFFQRNLIHWLRGRNYVRCFKGGKAKISAKASLKNVRIFVYANASLIVEDCCLLNGVEIYIEKGTLVIGRNTIIADKTIGCKNRKSIIINDGDVLIGNHSKIACNKIWVRFGGKLSIGDYTNINEGSEIRCDEKIIIGSYNQISYDVKIWDTNTHRILPIEERRKVTKQFFPYFGLETSPPKTSAVIIGNDCWIGERAALLKGTTIGNGSIIGFNTILIGTHVPESSCCVTSIQLKILPCHA